MLARPSRVLGELPAGGVGKATCVTITLRQKPARQRGPHVERIDVSGAFVLATQPTESR